MLVDAQQAVLEFHRTFNLPISNSPNKLERNRIEFRAKWMMEEIEEFLESTNIVDQADAIADLIYFALGVFVEMGIDGSKIFEIVHQANMNKLGQNNKPLYNEEGKVTKPDNWVSPHERIEQWLAVSLSCAFAKRDVESV